MSQDELFKIHIDMWKHYDDLRQAKNTGFLTANSILVAVVALLFKDLQKLQGFGANALMVLPSLVGVFICGAWYMLLTRNSAYIEFHRGQAGAGDKAFWTPENTRTHRSRLYDRTPSLAFLAFWVFLVFFALLRQPSS
jgi:hypothetical protein